MSEDLVQGIIESAALPSGHPGTEARVWAARITECWRSSVEGILRTGRLLIEAKANLPFGEFGRMIESDLPFGERTAQRLMAIGQDNRLSNPTHVSLLPASWGTLYELTKLSDEEFSSAVQQRVIRPDMLRGEAEVIRPLTKESQSESNQRHTASPDMMSAPGLRVGAASADLPATSERMDVTAGETAPNSAPLPNGARAIMGSRQEADDSLDFFPTPPWATRALIEHVFPHIERRGHCKWQIAWEPACGEGHIAEVLGEYFGDVASTDIHDYGYGHGPFIDFVESKWASENHDWIITNPPFGDVGETFVLKAIELAGTGVAMFMRVQWLDSIGRYERIFKDKPPTLIAFFAERVNLCKGRWDPEGSTATAYMWLVWIKGAEPRAPFWIPPGCREGLTKPDDVERFTVHPVKRRVVSTQEDEVA
jgi:Protein of unknown function (DUF3102)